MEVVNAKQKTALHQSSFSASESGYLTPAHIKTLRKELNQRNAKGTLQLVYLSEDECLGPFSEESLASIVEGLRKAELLQVRGISRNDRRTVKQTTDRLALELSMESGQDVYVVDIKGHAASLYQPYPGEVGVQLRTTGKGNSWMKKAKAPRDERGQIIR